MQQPIFVVGTGRCGSTLLSTFFRQWGGILSLSEFFVSLSPRAFEKKVLDGAEFWEILSQPRPKATHMLRHGLEIPEFLYRSTGGVAPILLMTLPHLSDEPEQLLNRVRDFVLQLKKDTLANHYLCLFEWLRRLFGRQVWVERSGGSLRFVWDLLALYPDARFIHIFRDGRECALSMSRHHAFRLTAIQTLIKERVGRDPFADPIPAELHARLGDLARLLPDRFEVEIYQSLKIPIETFGALWSSQIVQGLNALCRVPPGNLLDLRYEDLLARPEAEIEKLMSFILPSFDNQDWVRRMARIVHTDKKPGWVRLDPEEQRRLTRACAIGLRLLHYNASV